MQKTKPQPGITQQYSMDEYLQLLNGALPAEDSPLRTACEISWSVQDKDSGLPSGLDVALILRDLGVDQVTLVVALLGDSRLHDEDLPEPLAKLFSEDIVHMVKSVRWLHDFQFDSHQSSAPDQAERLRRMLLSMVEDVRVMLIKLA